MHREDLALTGGVAVCGAKKLVGGDGDWRVRTGDYRVVYEIHDDVLLILVLAVGHRRGVYQHR